jgi:hypothetical protein
MLKKICAGAACASAVLMAGAGSAQADILIYTSREAFTQAAGPVGVDSFEDLGEFGIGASALRFAGQAGYAVSAGGNGLYAAGGWSDWWLSTNSPADALAFAALGGAKGVGGYFFGTDFTGQATAGSLVLTASDSNSTVRFTLDVADASTFVGFVSDQQMRSLTVANALLDAAQFVTVNDLTMSAPLSPAPEAASLGMFLAGLAIVGVAGGRRRRAAECFSVPA